MKTFPMDRYPGAARRLGAFVFGLVAFAVLGLCALHRKPLWIDEVGAFALAGFDSTADAGRVFFASVGGINHGQTGFYYMLDFWLLKLLGPSPFAVRLPTYIYTLFLFFSARHLFKQWKLAFHWQLWWLLAFFTTPTLAFHVSEGRAYIPLAACGVGCLAYYFTSQEARRGLVVRFIGWFAVVTGAVMHPYFPLYWVAAVGISLTKVVLERRADGQARNTAFPRLAELIGFCDPKLVLAGSLLYFGIGALTWLGHMKSFDYDPLQWLPREIPLSQHILVAHFQFINGAIAPFLFVFAFASLALAGAAAYRWLQPSLIAAQLITFGGLALTALTAYASYRSGYWIIHRQWVGSVAFTVLGSTWFAGLMARALNRPASIIWTLLLFALVGTQAVNDIKARIELTRHYMNSPLSNTPGATVSQLPDPASNDDFVNMANVNCEQGGPVTPRLRKFYGY